MTTLEAEELERSKHDESACAPTPVQLQLQRLWSSKLDIDDVGFDDDFFELGGDSLVAAELQIEIDRAFGVEISATTLFRSPTVMHLAAAIEAAREHQQASLAQAGSAP